MSKESSKADQLRGLREAKFERNKKPPGTVRAQVGPQPSHERNAQVAALQEKSECIQKKSVKQPSREGKKQIAVWLNEQLVKDLKHRSVELDETIEAIVARGVEMALDRGAR
jgi:hypothetical protein